MDHLEKLAALVEKERAGILSRWRRLVRELPSARELDVETLNDHIPGLLEELAMALRGKSEQAITKSVAERSATAHGLQRLRVAFDIQEVVAEYNVLRGCLHDLADENGLELQGKPFHTINRVFDAAIGLALETYATQRALEVQRRREEYLAFLVHDLRTPLSVISLAGKVLENTMADRGTGDEAAQMIKALRRSVQHLQTLVSKVLEENANLQVESGTKLERREFDLWPFVQAVVHDLYPVAGDSKTALRNQVPDDLVIYADAGLVKRVFQNLIGNAIKYTSGGAIEIGARELGDEGTVEIWVRDNGAGIPASMIERVFDKGETDQVNEGGMGLGLAIVKTFVEAHDGKVAVESKEGEGSTFRIWLPRRGS